MTSPNAGTYDVLTIDFGEALDYVLIQHTIKIVDSEKKPVAGKIQITGHQHVVDFIPDESWHRGRYILQIEGRLEDLAGNNLNRRFEKDLLKEEKERKERGVFERKFEVK